MNISVCIESLKIDGYYIKEKEINISPITIFSENDIHLGKINLVYK